MLTVVAPMLGRSIRLMACGLGRQPLDPARGFALVEPSGEPAEPPLDPARGFALVEPSGEPAEPRLCGSGTSSFSSGVLIDNASTSTTRYQPSAARGQVPIPEPQSLNSDKCMNVEFQTAKSILCVNFLQQKIKFFLHLCIMSRVERVDCERKAYGVQCKAYSVQRIAFSFFLYAPRSPLYAELFMNVESMGAEYAREDNTSQIP